MAIGPCRVLVALSVALGLVAVPLSAQSRVAACGPFSAPSLTKPYRAALVACMPTPRSGLVAVAGGDGRIYAIGGDTSVDGQLQAVSTVEVYNPRTNTWTTGLSMPTLRQGMAATTGPRGTIYLLGGYSPQDHRIVGTVEIYDPRRKAWSTGPSMPTPRIHLAATTGRDGRIYAIGGVSGCTGESENLRCFGYKTVEAYDPRTGRWARLARLLTGRAELAAVTGRDGRIYAIGGYDALENALNTVEAYDRQTREWVKEPSMTRHREGFTAAVDHNGRIYVLGGAIGLPGSSGSEFGPPSPVTVYDPSVRRWMRIGSSPNARQYLAAATGTDGRIYAIGGYCSCGGDIGLVEVYSARP